MRLTERVSVGGREGEETGREKACGRERDSESRRGSEGDIYTLCTFAS